MRGKTAKRLRVYVEFLKAQDAKMEPLQRKFANFTVKNMERQVKRLWRKDKDFQKFIQAAVVTNR